MGEEIYAYTRKHKKKEKKKTRGKNQGKQLLPGGLDYSVVHQGVLPPFQEKEGLYRKREKVEPCRDGDGLSEKGK